MVDIKAYIESGVIESYVLGLVDDQEKKEVECLSKIYPEIGEELIAAQKAIEGFVQSISENPPDHVKQQLLEKIKNTPQASKENLYVDDNVSPPKAKKIKLWSNIAAAASIALLITVGVLTYQNRQLNQTVTANNVAHNESVNKLNQNLTQSQLQLKTIQNILANNTTQTVILKGTPLSPNSKASVYWNDQQQKIVLVNNNLPKANKKNQYQLWAIADGKPVDLGVLEATDSEMTIRDLSGIKNIQAFAITLEPNGGSPQPHLDQLYVIGEVSG